MTSAWQLSGLHNGRVDTSDSYLKLLVQFQYVQLMTVVIHLMFGYMFCHIFSSCHLSPAPQHAGKPKCDHVIKFSYNLLFTHFTHVDFPLVGHDLLNGTSS